MIVLVFIYYTIILYKILSFYPPQPPLSKGGARNQPCPRREQEINLVKEGSKNQPCQRGEQEINLVQEGSKKSTLSKGGARNQPCPRRE